jgi:regulator of PEP synthase PpsR (kinase-PPPase family)
MLKGHVVGLTIDPEKLRQIRLRRVQQEKIPGQDYSDINKINQELSTAERLFSELKCPVIDVTHHAVEETAALILKKLDLR